MVKKLIGLREIMAALGMGLLAAGLAMISVSLALIVCGALLIAMAVIPLLIPPHKGG